MGSTWTSFNLSRFLGINFIPLIFIHVRCTLKNKTLFEIHSRSFFFFFSFVLCNVHGNPIVRRFVLSLIQMYMGSHCLLYLYVFSSSSRLNLCEFIKTLSLIYIRKKCYFPLYSGFCLCVCVSSYYSCVLFLSCSLFLLLNNKFIEHKKYLRIAVFPSLLFTSREMRSLFLY